MSAHVEGSCLSDSIEEIAAHGQKVIPHTPMASSACVDALHVDEHASIMIRGGQKQLQPRASLGLVLGAVLRPQARDNHNAGFGRISIVQSITARYLLMHKRLTQCHRAAPGAPTDDRPASAPLPPGREASFHVVARPAWTTCVCQDGQDCMGVNCEFSQSVSRFCIWRFWYA
jgi:hypothetical protein